MTNRELFTVIGVGPTPRSANPDPYAQPERTGQVLYVRHADGTVAALPPDYVARHLVLGYAMTMYGAQGVTVDTAHALLDRDATREALYVAATRGRRGNYLWLVTDRAPDEHDPERVAQLAVERLTEVLETPGAQPAALAVRNAYQAEAASLASVVARLEVVAGWAARDRHDATLDRLTVDGVLHPAVPARLHSEAERPARDRLHRALQTAELAGHDPDHLLDHAVRDRELHTADTVADVLRHRITTYATCHPASHPFSATPAPNAGPNTGPGEEHNELRRWAWADLAACDIAAGPGAAGDHHSVGDQPAGARARYLAQLAELAERRTDDLVEHTAATAPAWAVESYGPVPDPQRDPNAHADWRERVRPAVAYRALTRHRQPPGLPRRSPQPRTRPASPPLGHRPRSHRHPRPDTPDGTGRDTDGSSHGMDGPDDGRTDDRAGHERELARHPEARDWRRASDTELYQARERWTRLSAQAPPWVAVDLARTHRLARDYAAEAVRHAAARLHPEQAPARHAAAETARRWAQHHHTHAARLEHAYSTRRAWADEHAPPTRPPPPNSPAATSPHTATPQQPPSRIPPNRPPPPPAPNKHGDCPNFGVTGVGRSVGG